MPISNGRTLKGNPRSAVLTQPFVQLPETRRRGWLIGPDIFHRTPVCLDPYGYKRDGITHAARYIVNGQLDAGKSAFMQTAACRMSSWRGFEPDGEPVPFRTLVFDRKMQEYRGITRRLHSKEVMIGGDGAEGIRFNPFDPVLNMGEVHMVDIAANYASDAKRSHLSGEEPRALQVAIYKMLARLGNRAPSIEMLEEVCLNLRITDLFDYYRSNSVVLSAASSLSPVETMAERMAQYQQDVDVSAINTVDTIEFELAAGRVASYLGEITRGRYGRSIGGDSSMIDAISQPMTTIIFGDITLGAQDLAYGTLLRWRTIARHSTDPRLKKILPHLQISDEEGKALPSKWHIIALSEEMRDARANMAAAFHATQYMRDTSSAGGTDPTIRAMAKSIDDAAAGYIMFRQPRSDETINTLVTRGWSEEDARRTTRLPVGYAAIRMGESAPVYTRVLLPQSDLNSTYSNKANDNQVVNRRSAWDDPDFRARAAILGMEIPSTHRHLLEVAP